MTKVMLIEATRPEEEVRVAILKDGRLDEYDYESAHKKTFKGNIYLAKVVRVEPSLQAAFVEYGNNRHGFLAFSEIHPDYFRIPVGDKERGLSEDEEEGVESSEIDYDDNDLDDEREEERVETVGGERGEDLVPMQKRTRPHRIYKIQEVIKRRQIMLVQVTKEERGNKGAALTTYLSLAGRYCVLMPNAARGGGISRRITDVTDRKRLRSLVSDLQIPEGVSVIVRTAGMDRSKAEIKRDYEYLMRLWTDIREQTLKSVAPHLIYEEADIIKRALRDLYTRDIDSVYIEGEEAHKTAKSFMKTLMPSHAKKIKYYEPVKEHIFDAFHIESQIEDIHAPEVRLPSGGYIVLNPTEALVSIDVNSGRSTKERNIESTALKTNLEAAAEIARQLRLRDLAGLIVIDFIDMDNGRYNAAVERTLKECMASDRARIQIGRISHFGLLELSRQRLRPSLLEASTTACHYCHGTGLMRAVGTQSLLLIKALESLVSTGRHDHLVVKLPTALAKHFFNTKRRALAELEVRHPVTLTFDICDHQVSAQILSADQHVLEEVSHLPPRRAGEGPLAPMRVEGEVIEAIVEDEEEEGGASPKREGRENRPTDRNGEGRKRQRVRKRSGQGAQQGQRDGQDIPISSENVAPKAADQNVPHNPRQEMDTTPNVTPPERERRRGKTWQPDTDTSLFAPRTVPEVAPHFVDLGTPALSSFVEFSVSPPPRPVPAMLADMERSATQPAPMPTIGPMLPGDEVGGIEQIATSHNDSSAHEKTKGTRRRLGRESKGGRLKSNPPTPLETVAAPLPLMVSEVAPAVMTEDKDRRSSRKRKLADKKHKEVVASAPAAPLPAASSDASALPEKPSKKIAKPASKTASKSSSRVEKTDKTLAKEASSVVELQSVSVPSFGAASPEESSAGHKRRGWWQKLVE